MKKAKMLLMISLIVLLPSELYADCASACRSAITAADRVIADQQKEIESYKTETDTLTKRITDLNVSLNEKIHADEAWYRNPFVIGAIGIIVGGAGVVYLKR